MEPSKPKILCDCVGNTRLKSTLAAGDLNEREKESQRAIDPIFLEGANQYCDFTDKETEVPGLYHFSKFLLSVNWLNSHLHESITGPWFLTYSLHCIHFVTSLFIISISSLNNPSPS